MASDLRMTPEIPSNLSDRQLLEMIWIKVQPIDSLTEKIDSFDSRISDLENRVQLAENQCEDLHRGTEFIEIEYENLKEEINYIKNNMVSKEGFRKLKQEMIDMSNRMRRKNLVFYNVPKGSLGESCTGFITDLAKKVNNDIVIETAHRSPTYDANAANRTNPRPYSMFCVSSEMTRMLFWRKGLRFTVKMKIR